MYHSITFGVGNDTKNTWTDWSLMPQSPPVIPPPTPKTNYVDIPGRIRGPIDLSEVPFNKMQYERITGSWTFVIRDDYWHDADRILVNEDIREWLHGRITKMVLEEDPSHFFYGRFTIVPAQSGAGPFALQIGFDLEPIRYNVNGSVDETWLCNITDSTAGSEDEITAITDPEIYALFHPQQ